MSPSSIINHSSRLRLSIIVLKDVVTIWGENVYHWMKMISQNVQVIIAVRFTIRPIHFL